MVRRGGLVVFPTETVYGVAVHVHDAQAVERLYQLKGRPQDKQLTIHLWEVQQVESVAREVSPLARRVMARFWPGPLTLVLPGRTTSTVGLRLPDHPVARQFLALCQVPVAAPSANRSGDPPPTDATSAIAALGHGVDAVIDSGPTTYRGPSTVLQILGEQARVLREGSISVETLRAHGVPLSCG